MSCFYPKRITLYKDRRTGWRSGRMIGGLILLIAALFLLTGSFTGDGRAASEDTSERPLVVVLGSAPATLDPFLATDANGVRITHQLIFETLVRLGDTLEITPGLGRWKRVTPTRFRFTLSGKARFSDGSPVEAADAVHTLRTFMKPETGSPYGAGLREKFTAVQADGSHAFTLDLKASFAKVLSDLILGDLVLPIVSRNHPGAGSDDPKALLGSGPFRLQVRRPGEIVLERNPHHPCPAGMARVVFKVVKDESTRQLKFRKGDVDLGVNVVPLDKLVRFGRSPLKKRYRTLEAPGLSFQYLGFNLRDPILGRPEVRRAIAHALDVETLITHRQRGHSSRATGLFPPGSPYADPTVKPIAYDPAKAANLLDEAGLPLKNGRRFRLTYKTSTDRSAVIQARVIAENLRKVGIEVTVRSFEWATFYADIKKGNFQLYSLRWIGVSDPGFLFELLHSSKVPPNGRNRGRYDNPAMDKLLERARGQQTQKGLREAFRAVHRMAAEDLPYLGLWHNNNVAVVSRSLEGFRLHPSGGFEHLSEVRRKP